MFLKMSFFIKNGVENENIKKYLEIMSKYILYPNLVLVEWKLWPLPNWNMTAALRNIYLSGIAIPLSPWKCLRRTAGSQTTAVGMSVWPFKTHRFNIYTLIGFTFEGFKAYHYLMVVWIFENSAHDYDSWTQYCMKICWLHLSAASIQRP